MKINIQILALATLFAFGLSSCGSEGTDYSEKAEDAMNKVEENASEALDKAGDKISETADELEDAAEDAFGGELSEEEVDDILKGDDKE